MWRSEEVVRHLPQTTCYGIQRSQCLLGWLVNKLLTSAIPSTLMFALEEAYLAMPSFLYSCCQTHALLLTRECSCSLGLSPWALPLSAIFNNINYYVWEDQSHFWKMTLKGGSQRWARNSCSRGLDLDHCKVIGLWTNLQHSDLSTVLTFLSVDLHKHSFFWGDFVHSSTTVLCMLFEIY